MTRIDDIKARLDAATDGPWGVDEIEGCVDYDGTDGVISRGVRALPNRGGLNQGDQYELFSLEDATFIANAPTDIAYLLRLVEELDESLDRLMIVQPQQCWCHELDPDDIDDGCECQMCYAAAVRKRAEETKT